MTFALHISFVGLCLSTTSQDKTSRWTLSVAMPNTDYCDSPDSSDDPGDCHKAALVYDGRYARKESAFERTFLSGCTLDFSNIGASGEGFHPQLPSELVDLATLLGPGALKPFTCGKSEDDNVTCLTTIRHGSCAGIGLPKTWKLLGENKRLTHCMEWRIENIEGDALNLSSVGVPSDDGNPVILYPIDSPDGLEIRFSLVCLPLKFICHEPKPDAPPQPNTPALHFPMFSCLFDPWYPNVVPVSTAAEEPLKGKGGSRPPKRLPTLTAQDCIGAGYGGGG